MELRGKALPILILMAILSTLVIAGCNRDEQAPRRPVTPREKTTTEDSTLTRKAQQPPTQATATEIRKLADRLTNKAVEVGDAVNIPIYEALLEYCRERNVLLHMPGHKGGRGFTLSEFQAVGMVDFTEVPCTPF